MKNIELVCKEDNIRINKFLSINNVYSRREADRAISEGKVKISLARKNNDIYVIATLGTILSINDKVKVEVQSYSCYLYNKARNEVSPDYIISKHIKPIAPLPKQYSGIVIYSDDNSLVKSIANSDSIEYEYVIKTKEAINKLSVGRLLGGVQYEGVQYRAASSARIIDNDQRQLKLVLNEYKENIISRILDAVRLNVDNVHRSRIGNIGLNGVDVGTHKELDIKDII